MSWQEDLIQNKKEEAEKLMCEEGQRKEQELRIINAVQKLWEKFLNANTENIHIDSLLGLEKRKECLDVGPELCKFIDSYYNTRVLRSMYSNLVDFLQGRIEWNQLGPITNVGCFISIYKPPPWSTCSVISTPEGFEISSWPSPDQTHSSFIGGYNDEKHRCYIFYDLSVDKSADILLRNILTNKFIFEDFTEICRKSYEERNKKILLLLNKGSDHLNVGRVVGSDIKSEDRSEPHPNREKCFIATAIYGSDLMPEVIFLKTFRDQVLNRYILGRLVIVIYDNVSPPLASFIENKTMVKNIVRRLMLTPLVRFISRRFPG